MHFVCPRCSTAQEVQPGEVLGHLHVCDTCHTVFTWKDHLVYKNSGPRRPLGSKEQSAGPPGSAQIKEQHARYDTLAPRDTAKGEK